MTSVAERFQAVVHTQERFPWRTIGPAIDEIMTEAFGEPDDPLLMRDLFTYPDTIAVLLADPHITEIAGLSVASPISHIDPDRTDDRTTAFVGPNAIRGRYRRQGLLPPLLGTMERELRRRGFQYAEGDAQVLNGHADTLVKVYGSRIVSSADIVDPYSKIPLKSLRIRLQ